MVFVYDLAIIICYCQYKIWRVKDIQNYLISWLFIKMWEDEDFSKHSAKTLSSHFWFIRFGVECIHECFLLFATGSHPLASGFKYLTKMKGVKIKKLQDSRITFVRMVYNHWEYEIYVGGFKSPYPLENT